VDCHWNDKEYIFKYVINKLFHVGDGVRSSQTVIVVTASMKEYERGGQGHTSASLLHQSAM
jgi:hypothetical protein